MSDSDQIDQCTSAEVSLELAADIDQVWQALVTDGGLEPWMGRGATIDPRPDGVLDVPDIVGGLARRGLVHTVEDRSELGFTWWPEHRPIERSDVSITLTRTDIGTRITVTETPAVAVGSSTSRSSTNLSTGSSAVSASIEPSLTNSLRGCWSWRLTVLALASQMARI